MAGTLPDEFYQNDDHVESSSPEPGWAAEDAGYTHQQNGKWGSSDLDSECRGTRQQTLYLQSLPVAREHEQGDANGYRASRATFTIDVYAAS